MRIARANEKHEGGTMTQGERGKKHKGGTCVSMGCAKTKQTEVKQKKSRRERNVRETREDCAKTSKASVKTHLYLL